MRASRKVHDVATREHWDKFVLLTAFLIGVLGGIALKVLGFHPFVTAAFSAGVLVTYATLAYTATALRLEPEVIGDNAYYLGFLFTLTSLSVTLYFVIEAGAEDRARLIPEVISGFGVALVSTIMGVFIRVLMMQFRLDIVARERETRVEIDQAARQLRTEMIQALQQMKIFGVESMQHAHEREEKFAQTTEQLVKNVQQSLGYMSNLFYEVLQKTVRDQSTAAVEVIRTSVQGASETALRQMQASLEDIARSARGLADAQLTTQDVNEQGNAKLSLQVQAMTDAVAQLSRRLRSTAEEVEASGAALSRSISAAAGKMDQSLSETSQKLDARLAAVEASSREATERAELALFALNQRIAAAKQAEDKPA